MINSKSILKYTMWIIFFISALSAFLYSYLIFPSANWGVNLELHSLLSFADLLIPQVPKSQTATTSISHLSFFYLLLVLWIYSLLTIINSYLQ